MPPSVAPRLNLFVANNDPRRYLPRPATERALAALERRIVAERSLGTLLVGPSGIGKSLLLRVLARRVRSALRCIVVPAMDLDAAGFCTFVLDQLRVDPDGDPEQALALRGADWGERGAALLIAIDDADDLPIATAERLGAIALTADGGLRFLAALSSPKPDLVRALADDDAIVELRDPLNRSEADAFVQASLAAGWAPPAVRALFEGPVTARLHEDSQGNPARLAECAAAVVADAVREGLVTEPGQASYRKAWRSLPARGPIVEI